MARSNRELATEAQRNTGEEKKKFGQRQGGFETRPYEEKPCKKHYAAREVIVKEESRTAPLKITRMRHPTKTKRKTQCSGRCRGEALTRREIPPAAAGNLWPGMRPRSG